MDTYLEDAIAKCGGVSAVSRMTGRSPQAVLKWIKAGRLPRTEWTGETEYAKQIERASKGKVKARDLLRVKRSA